MKLFRGNNKREGGPPQYSFWAPEIASLRQTFIKSSIAATMCIIIACYAFVPIYWGALWKTPEYVHNLNGYVVNMDNGPIGEAVEQLFQGLNGQPRQPTYQEMPGSEFPNGIYGEHDTVQDAVLHHRAWFAVVVTPGASDRLNDATQNADGSYNATDAIHVLVDQARNENAYGSYLNPAISEALAQFSQSFSIQNAAQLVNQNTTNLLINSPQVVVEPASYTLVNLHPFDIPVATAVQFVGLIYLLIFSFIVCMQGYGLRMPLVGKLPYGHLLRLRFAYSFIAYFFISLNFGLVSVAFQVPFNRHYGKGGFVIYWMLLYLGMLALGLAMECMISILTPKFIAFFLMLWILSNVAVALQPIEILPSIYRYGYASPFFNISQAVRTILFDERNMMGLNFGVLFAWVGISLLTICFSTWWEKRGVMKAISGGDDVPPGVSRTESREERDRYAIEHEHSRGGSAMDSRPSTSEKTQTGDNNHADLDKIEEVSNKV